MVSFFFFFLAVLSKNYILLKICFVKQVRKKKKKEEVKIEDCAQNEPLALCRIYKPNNRNACLQRRSITNIKEAAVWDSEAIALDDVLQLRSH